MQMLEIREKSRKIICDNNCCLLNCHVFKNATIKKFLINIYSHLLFVKCIKYEIFGHSRVCSNSGRSIAVVISTRNGLNI